MSTKATETYIDIMCPDCKGAVRDSFDESFSGCDICLGFGIKVDCWSNETKTPEALDTAKAVGCLMCGKKPRSANPLDHDFCFDTMEPNNGYVYCDDCTNA